MSLSFNTTVSERSIPLLAAAERRNSAKNVFLGVILPIIATVGIIMLTNTACNQWTDTGLTHTATLGLYSSVCLLATLMAVSSLILSAILTHKPAEQRKTDVELMVLHNLLGNASSEGNVQLNDLTTIPSQTIRDRIKQLEDSLPASKQKKVTNNEYYRENYSLIVKPLALSILAILGTIFASEYLPLTGLSHSSWQSLCGVGFPAALYVIWTLAIRNSVENPDEKKGALSALQPLCLFALTMLGTVFASQYLPNVGSDPTMQGATALFCITGLTATALSITDVSLHEKNKKQIYRYMIPMIMLAGSILATIYASQSLTSLSANEMRATCAAIAFSGVGLSIAFLNHLIIKDTHEYYRDKEGSSREKALWSWLVPLIFLVGITMLSSVYAYEEWNHNALFLTIPAGLILTGGAILRSYLHLCWEDIKHGIK